MTYVPISLLLAIMVNEKNKQYCKKKMNTAISGAKKSAMFINIT
ncbi:hypothetical protein [Candidatus Tisiphia endosymbiont of Nemotelus uliginosus]